MNALKRIFTKKRKKLYYSPYSKTIRLMPENYWVASIIDGEVVFNSWDGMTKELFESGKLTQRQVIKFFNKEKR